MSDVDTTAERIMDAYEYVELLYLLLGYDHLHEEIAELTGVDDDDFV